MRSGRKTALPLALTARILMIVHSDTTKLKIESAKATIANEPCGRVCVNVSSMDVRYGAALRV